MPQVILKRNFNTPLGRFKASRFGVPMEIPQRVIDRYGLPSDAEVVGPDYVPPSQREPEEEAGTSMEAMEAEINRRVEAKLREAEIKANAKVAAAAEKAADDEDKHKEPDVLDMTVAQIKKKLPDMEWDELVDLLSREKAGNTRASLVAAIEAAMEEFEVE